MKLTKQKLYKLIREAMYENAESRKKIFVLVGPPSVGKSHWIKNSGIENPYIINRDDIVNEVAGEMGWTYDDLFYPPPKEAQLGEKSDKYGTVVKSPSWMGWQPLSYDKVLQANNQVQTRFTSRVSGAAPSGRDIIIDMTNMNARARTGALDAIKGAEENYEKIAVVFKFKGAEEIIKKVAAKRAEEARKEGKSKTIPPEAFDRMFGAFQKVESSEDFDEVISVDNIKALRQIVNDMDAGA